MHLIHSVSVDGVGNTARAVIRYPGRVEAMRLTRAQIVDGTGFEPGALFEQVTDYNGWSNRETWAVALHINNDQGWQEQVHEALRAWVGDMPDPDDEIMGATAYGAGDLIRENVEENLFGDLEDLDELPEARDALRQRFAVLQDIGSMWRVDWNEIGAAFLSDIAEES